MLTEIPGMISIMQRSISSSKRSGLGERGAAGQEVAGRDNNSAGRRGRGDASGRTDEGRRWDDERTPHRPQSTRYEDDRLGYSKYNSSFLINALSSSVCLSLCLSVCLSARLCVSPRAFSYVIKAINLTTF
jgi:hypothetical protein